MSQTTLDDDELFTEAASEIRTDIETALDSVRENIPDPDSIWTVESENTLGVLNALRSALTTEDAMEDLRDAKKWFMMGERAGAFDDADDLEAEIEELEELFTAIEQTRNAVSDVTRTLPDLRSDLESHQTTDE
jgi:hypothetical protein